VSVQGIRGGGSPSALAALRLAFRQAQPGKGVGEGEAAEGTREAGAAGGSAPELLAPEAVMRDIVGRAQFMASLRAASAAVEQGGTMLQAVDGGEPVPQR
jgi:hypothetical protein